MYCFCPLHSFPISFHVLPPVVVTYQRSFLLQWFTFNTASINNCKKFNNCNDASRFPYVGSWCVLSTVVTQCVMAAVCFQTMFIHFLGFQLFMTSQLVHLPICVICVATQSVSHYLCHLCRLLICVISVTLWYMGQVSKGLGLQCMYAICDKYCRSHGCATRKKLLTRKSDIDSILEHSSINNEVWGGKIVELFIFRDFFNNLNLLLVRFLN